MGELVWGSWEVRGLVGMMDISTLCYGFSRGIQDARTGEDASRLPVPRRAATLWFARSLSIRARSSSFWNRLLSQSSTFTGNTFQFTHVEYPRLSVRHIICPKISFPDSRIHHPWLSVNSNRPVSGRKMSYSTLCALMHLCSWLNSGYPAHGRVMLSLRRVDMRRSSAAWTKFRNLWISGFVMSTRSFKFEKYIGHSSLRSCRQV